MKFDTVCSQPVPPFYHLSCYISYTLLGCLTLLFMHYVTWVQSVVGDLIAFAVTHHGFDVSTQVTLHTNRQTYE